MRKLILTFIVVIGGLLIFHFSAKSAIAQSDTSGYILCDSMCNTTPFPGCQSGYRVPDLCVGQEANCCRVLAANGIGGSCDPSTGICSCTATYHNCVEDTSTPTPAPECAPDWTCIKAGTPSVCDFYTGTWTPCFISPGINGDCCRPPDLPLSPCVLNGAYCRPPSEQTSPGSCEWNEIELPTFTPSCEVFGSPSGTLCCDGITLIACSSVSVTGGECRDACQAGETPYSGVTECSNPALYPPSGATCCLLSGLEGPKPAPVMVFCDGSGDPTDDPSSGKIYTAIGCIPITDQQAFAEWILQWAIGIAGGIAIILIIYASFMVISSGGNPQRLQAGKELLTAAVMGIILLLFGAYILTLVGIQIFQIPGL